MNTPAPKTSPDAALGNLMAAALDVPAAPLPLLAMRRMRRGIASCERHSPATTPAGWTALRRLWKPWA